jgi:uncharacterized protein YecE (DUF72 family)
MQTEKKSNYILITSDENSFSEFYTAFLEKGITKDHIIIQFSDAFNITKKNLSLFLDFARSKKENGTSFVVVTTEVDIDDFPETFNIVPTLSEAEDILEMEAIERELGF